MRTHRQFTTTSAVSFLASASAIASSMTCRPSCRARFPAPLPMLGTSASPGRSVAPVGAGVRAANVAECALSDGGLQVARVRHARRDPRKRTAAGPGQSHRGEGAVLSSEVFIDASMHVPGASNQDQGPVGPGRPIVPWRIVLANQLPVRVTTQSNNGGNTFWTLSSSLRTNTHCYWWDGDRDDPDNLHFTLGIAVGPLATFHATWREHGYVQHFQCTVDPNAPAGNPPALDVAVAPHPNNSAGTAGPYAVRIRAYAEEIAPQVFRVQYDQPSERERKAVKSAAAAKKLDWLKKPSQTGRAITKTSQKTAGKRFF